MVRAKKFVYNTPFEGFPKESDLMLVEEELRPLKDGEFLSEAIFLSVDPYMRAYASRINLGDTYLGSQVAKIIESRHPDYQVGQYVVGEFGWCTHSICDGNPIMEGLPKAWIIPDPEGFPLSYSLGVLGMPGNTAYFGFLEICKPQPGETVVVSGAAGAVGSIVGQIAKIKGCTVIGIAGSDEKGEWLRDELNFDQFINYKKPNFAEKLLEATPDGVDCYFDNVGGEISSLIITRMNTFGRISVCGSISGYNDIIPSKATTIQFFMVLHQLKMEGFIADRWLDRWFEGIAQNKEWIKECKLKYRETVTSGFENMPKAFIDMLKGKNIGKAIVKV